MVNIVYNGVILEYQRKSQPINAWVGMVKDAKLIAIITDKYVSISFYFGTTSKSIYANYYGKFKLFEIDEIDPVGIINDET